MLQALLPLARRHMASNAALPWLTLGLGAALLLAESAQQVGGLLQHGCKLTGCSRLSSPRAPHCPPVQLWLSGAGNANFLYGITLLWAGLQVVLLLQLLRAAARAEAAPVPAADAAAGAEEEQQLQKRGASEPGSSGKQD